MDRGARETRDVRNLFVQADHGGVDGGKSSLDQEFLDGIDLMAGERHIVELRRIGREKTSRNPLCDTTERVVAMGVPDAEQITAARSAHTLNLRKGLWSVRQAHHAALALDHG